MGDDQFSNGRQCGPDVVLGVSPVAGRKIDTFNITRQFAKPFVGHEMKQVDAVDAIANLLKVFRCIVDEADIVGAVIK